ncbi:unnamed protein product [Linum trigynum]|uniref:Uncharacterized protein n=1 Tax=Linum trigynum TaxID=586398 RepID=A0AAV2E8M1_9ROSI
MAAAALWRPDGDVVVSWRQMAAAASWRLDGSVVVLWRQIAAAASWREMAETRSGWRRGGRWRRRQTGGMESEGKRRRQGRVRAGGDNRESRGGDRESARWGWSRRLASRNAEQQRNGGSIIQFRRIRVRERGHWTSVVFTRVRMRRLVGLTGGYYYRLAG